MRYSHSRMKGDVMNWLIIAGAFLVLLIGVAVTILFFYVLIGRCISAIVTSMPVMQWMTLDEVVRLSNHGKWLTQVGLGIIVRTGRADFRLKKAIGQELMRKAREMVKLEPDEEIIVFAAFHFKDMGNFEYRLRFLTTHRVTAYHEAEEPALEGLKPA